MSEKTLDLTVDEWMGMYHIAADRADKAEAEVERLIKINQECEQEAHIQDEILRRYKAENAKLRQALREIADF